MPIVTPDLLNRIPKLTLPDGRVVSLVNDLSATDPIPSNLRQRAIRLLKAYLEEAQALPDGTIMEGGVTKHALVDTVSWQLAKFLRDRRSSSRPHLRYRVHKTNKNGRVTVIPTLYLGVALSRIEGEEENAITTFSGGFDNLFVGPEVPALNLIWARANFARMLRRMNKIKEAEDQESLTRLWILQHPYSFPPSTIASSLSDDLGTGTNILDHPDILHLFENIVELV